MAKNTEASIRQKLLKLSRDRKETFDFVLTQYVLQRILYRISISEYAKLFCLKGALLFWVWNHNYHRPTRDMDLLSFGENDLTSMKQTFNNILKIKLDDGLNFDLTTLQAIKIKEEAKYQGVRLNGYAFLDGARNNYQIDIGFGDAIEKNLKAVEIPTFFEDFPKPQMRVYSVNAVIAEKFHAMVFLGLQNSRLKDFYDMYTIASSFPLMSNDLMKAINLTFDRRKMVINNKQLFIFTDQFKLDDSKEKQWQLFLKKNRLDCELNFSEVMNKIDFFLKPIYEGINQNNSENRQWDFKIWEWVKE